jgi:hypothetical protein
VPLLAGRVFDGRDRADSLPTVLVNEAFKRSFFSEGGAVGRRISLGSGDPAWLEVVGVVGDIHQNRLDQQADPWIYRCYFQNDIGGILRRTGIVIRVSSGSILSSSLLAKLV